MKLTFLWATLLTLLAAPALATTVSLAPSPAAVLVGDTFQLNVRVTEASHLYAFQFDLNFDPLRVQVHELLEGGFLAAGGGTTLFVPGTIDNVAGTVSFTASTLVGPGPGESGDGILVHLLFQALSEGASELSFGNVVLLDSRLAELDFSTGTGVIEVSAPGGVPEAPSALLVGIGLAALIKGSRRRLSTPNHIRARP